MTQAVVSFMDFTPSNRVRSLFDMRANQFLDFVPTDSQIRMLIKQLKDGISFHAFVLMNTAWGEIKVQVDDSSLDDLLDRVGARLKTVVNHRRRRMTGPDPTATSLSDDDSAFKDIQSFEDSLATGG